MNIAAHLLVVAGPSGVGKSTLVRALVERFERLDISVSYTTRAPRGQERDGVHYHFVSHEEFEARRDAGEFAEWARVHGHFYGTSKRAIEAAIAAGRDLLFDIDVQGTEQLKAAYPELWAVLIVPPSLDELAQRLEARGTDSAEVRARRMAKAEWELSQTQHFDFCLVNDVLECSAERFASIYQGMRQRVGRRNTWHL